MGSIPTLDHIPAETSQRIFEHLDSRDLWALRLTSRRVCSAASQGSFTKHFRKKTKSLSSAVELQRLSESVGESEHARKLQHLEFWIAEDEPMDAAKMDSIAEIVTAALRALQRHLAEGCLQRLSIRLQESGELRDWERAWQVVAGAWAVLMRSLTASSLVINELDVFTKSSGSVSFDKFYPSVSWAALAGCFNRMRSLDLSLSHSIEDALDDSKQSVEKSQSYCNTLCDFVNLCPALQHLGLHWYTLTYDDDTAPLLEQRNLLDYIVRQCAISSLQSVSLRGIHTSQAALLRLAEKSQLRSVEMDNTYMAGNDIFRPFFDYITPKLENVSLSDLCEEYPIEFDLPEPPGIRQEWIRKGASARQPIQYHQSGVMPNGEIEVVRKMRKRQLDYGPPKGN